MKDAGVLRVIAGLNNFSNAGTKEVQDNATDSQSLNVANISSQAGSLNPASFGVANSTTVTTNYTETASKLVGGILVLAGTPGAFTLTTPTAAQILVAMLNPCIRQQLDWFVINATNGQATIAPGSGVSFAGVTSAGDFIVASGGSRLFKIQISDPASGSQAATIYG